MNTAVVGEPISRADAWRAWTGALSFRALSLSALPFCTLFCLLLIAAPPGVAAEAGGDEGVSDELVDTPSSGQVYRYVDADGNVLFTDQRPEGAEPVTVPRGNQFEGREAAERARAASEASRRGAEDEPADQEVQAGGAPEAEREQKSLQEELEERVAACEQSNVADCSPATVLRRIEEERYRQTPEGRRQQQAIGNQGGN